MVINRNNIPDARAETEKLVDNQPDRMNNFWTEQRKQKMH